MAKGKSILIASDRQALLLVVSLIALVALFFWLGSGDNGETDTRLAAEDSLPDPWKNRPDYGERHYERAYNYAEPTVQPETFPFDPNTADSTTLLRLGLRPWQVKNIYKYRARGGVYRKPTDFARLYGLSKKDYRRLEPFIRISDDYQPAAQLVEPAPKYERDTVKYPIKIKETEHIALNSADTSQLKRVPGIGSGFARAIVGYRERLGGFVSPSQLSEISNFPVESIKYFTVDNASPRKLNLNTASMQTLRRHPYISYYQAKAILDKRRQHRIESFAELSLLRDFPPEAIRRLEPYVEF